MSGTSGLIWYKVCREGGCARPRCGCSKGEGAGLAEPGVYFWKGGSQEKGSVLETGGY